MDRVGKYSGAMNNLAARVNNIAADIPAGPMDKESAAAFLTTGGSALFGSSGCRWGPLAVITLAALAEIDGDAVDPWLRDTGCDEVFGKG